MKVYVVTRDSWDEKYIENIFITEKLAQAYIDKRQQEDPNDYFILESYRVILGE